MINELHRHAEEAHRLLAGGRVRAALEVYETAVGMRPDFLPARLGRLLALIAVGDAAGAVIEARCLCRLLNRRGDVERIPDIRATVGDAFPWAEPMLGPAAPVLGA